MSISDYVRSLRAKVGHDLLVMPSAATVVRNEDGAVLLVRHLESGKWGIPGGIIEPEELPADAAVRETWEETGLHVDLTGIVGVFGGPDLVVHYANGDRVSYVGTIFHGRPVGGHLKPDGFEIVEARFFTSKEILEVRLAPWLPPILGRDGGPQFQHPSWSPPTPHI